MKRALRLVALVAAAAAGAHVHAQTEQTREGWQRVADLFAAAGVRAGARIADVGAGDGFLTVRLAPAVGPSGTVYAVDIDANVLDGLQRRVADAGLSNVKIVVAAEDDPHLPRGGIDGVVILNAYHEMPRGIAVLTHVRDALRSGGHVVLCEPVPETPNQARKAQMDEHVLDPNLIVDDLRAAGFEIIDRQDSFATNLGGTHFGLVVAKRP